MNKVDVININEHNISIKEFKGQRVVTFKDIDIVHQRPMGTAKRNFNGNKDKFIENEDYYFVKPKDIRAYEIRTSEINNSGAYLITESGYLMLVKAFTDDLAWKIQRQLVNTYFRARQQQPQDADDKSKLTEAKLMNARARISNQLLKLSRVETLSKEYKNILVAKATEVLIGEQLIPLPNSKQKTYSATDIANMFGVSANKIGSLANKNNLKTEQYGEFYRDKSPYSSKEVDSFRYFDSAIPEFEKILGMKVGALA